MSVTFIQITALSNSIYIILAKLHLCTYSVDTIKGIWVSFGINLVLRPYGYVGL